MKKLPYGLLAILLAVGAMAFTKANTQHAARTSYYWFETDAVGNVIDPSTEPPLSASDPFDCGNLTTIGCSKAFDSFQQSGDVYVPDGSLEIVDTKNQ